jgi:hypothetical protein
MAQFWEFFTFELKFRAKSISTYVYFLLFFALSFMASPAKTSSSAPAMAKSCSTAPTPPASTTSSSASSAHHHGRHLRHLHPARLPARHHTRSSSPSRSPSSPTSAAAGPAPSSPPSLSSPDARSADSSARSPPGPTTPASPNGAAHWYFQPSSHHRRPDLLPRLALLSHRRPLPQDLHRLSAGRGDLHPLPHRRINAIFAPRVRSNTSGPPSSTPSASSTSTPSPATGPSSKEHLLYSWSGVFLYNRLLWISRRPSQPHRRLYLLPHVGRNAHLKVSRASAPPCSASRMPHAKPRPLPRRRRLCRSSTRSSAPPQPSRSSFRSPASASRTSSRAALLGHPHPHGDALRPAQRPLRRPVRGTATSGPSPTSCSGRRGNSFSSSHRRHPLCRRTHLARARHPLRRHPRRAPHARIHRLALEARRPLLSSNSSCSPSPASAASSCRPFAGYFHYELFNTSKSSTSSSFPGPHLHPPRALHPDHRLEQVHRHGIVIGIFVITAHPAKLWLGEHALSVRQHPSSPTRT